MAVAMKARQTGATSLVRLVGEFVECKKQADFWANETKMLRSEILETLGHPRQAEVKIGEHVLTIVERKTRTINQEKLIAFLARRGIDKAEFEAEVCDVSQSAVLSVK
jgi:hypothetical protein